MTDTLFTKGYRYEIFIGIKDKDTYEELLTVEDFTKILSEICTEKKNKFYIINPIRWLFS